MLTGATIVFDLDGTLADTLPDIARAVNAVLAQSGHTPLGQEVVRSFVGEGSRVLLARSFAVRGRTLAAGEVEAAYDAFIAFHRAHLADATALYPGAAETLEALAEAGATLAVCTNKPGVLARGVLDALGVADRFGAVVGGDSLPVRKPDPAALLGAIRAAGGDPARAAMVGDSHIDIETARRAGIPVIAVDFGYSDAPVAAFGPDRVIGSFAELLPAAAGLFARALT